MAARHARRIVRLTFVALAAGWGLFLSMLTVASLPYNPLSMSLRIEIGVRSLVPEGWGFFTREPRSLDLRLYRRVGDAWSPMGRLPIAHPKNLLGIDRWPRAIPVELGTLLDQVEPEDWVETTDGPGGAVSSGRAVPVRNPMPHPRLCGHLRVLSREPVPWAWFAAGGDVEMPAWVAEMEVQCSPGSIADSMS